MSLLTDIIFVKALRSNSDLMEQLPDGDVHNTSIALPDEDMENAEIPYIIVSYDGMQNDGSTKDDIFEGDSDNVQISIDVAANDRESLGTLMTTIRRTVNEYFASHYGDDSDEDFQLIPMGMTIRALPVRYDSEKPCYWQILQYDCETRPD